MYQFALGGIITPIHPKSFEKTIKMGNYVMTTGSGNVVITKITPQLIKHLRKIKTFADHVYTKENIYSIIANDFRMYPNWMLLDQSSAIANWLYANGLQDCLNEGEYLVFSKLPVTREYLIESLKQFNAFRIEVIGGNKIIFHATRESDGEDLTNIPSWWPEVEKLA